ncbi:MAG TPA: hypothetical protein VKZ63_05245, partial [Kofleriaceae bacterium]|nr:hypothetical protein [Kofleriaceae bacterium]
MAGMLAPRTAVTLALALELALAACGLDLDPPPGVIHARFDPDARVIPMPSDVLRDEAQGRLAIPTDGVTGAELHLYQQLNRMDGWSSASAATVVLDGAIDPSSLTGDALQVWRWGPTPAPVPDARVRVSPDRLTVTIDPPRTGWDRGATYAVLLRGGERGARGEAGERLECDAAFYFLRLDQELDTPEHERAFPGATAEERRATAARLEAIRRELAPFFDFFAARGIPRDEVAALWSFTITRRVELAMDEASQRMPIPIDLLLDPASGRVDLPPAPWDSPTVLEAKERLAELDGFATSAGLLFQLTGALDPASVTGDSIELWRLGGAGEAPERVPASVALLADHASVEVTPLALPLDEATTYALVVAGGMRAADGSGPVALMPAGHLILSGAPVADGGASLVGLLADDDAVRLERVRGDTAALLAHRGRGDLTGAWTFTTMSVTAPLEQHMAQPAALAVPADPVVERR